MSFGENILKKFGWKEGDSLGKNGNGIVAPIKAHRKTDNSGLGTSKTAEITGGNWWERVYNEAAGNVNIEAGTSGEVKVVQKDKDGVEITNKSYSMRKLQQQSGTSTYGTTFLKAASLQEGKETEVENRTKLEDIQIKPTASLTDEQLFKACGGLTAHKGARHGLNLTGKLNRLEEQERLLMKKFTEQGEAKLFEMKTGDEKKTKVMKKKTRPSIIQPNRMESSEDDELKETLNTVDYHTKSTKKKKASQKVADNLSREIEKALSGLTEKSDVPQIEEDVNLTKIEEDSKAIKKAKKVRKKKRKQEKKEELLIQQALEMLKEESTKKNKKKKGRESPVAEDFLKQQPKPVETKKRKRLQSASSASEDDDIERINEQAAVRRIKVEKLGHIETTEFQQLHAEIAAEKGIEFQTKKSKKNMSKKKKKKTKRDLVKVEQETSSITI